jgi:DNA-binding NtrC family response regulator
VATRILFVDDEREIVSSFSRYFGHRGYQTAGAYNVADAVAQLTAASQPNAPRFDLVCTDLRMPDGDGLDVLRAVRRLIPGTPVLVLTAYGSVATSVQAMRLGAITMLEKPIPVADLEREIMAAVADSQKVSAGLADASHAGLVGGSPQIRQLFDTLVRVAPSTSSVLIQGESGTGKELVAQAIHKLSRRAAGPLVAVNCAAIPDTLLESELFGHAKGAFTGAVTARPGKFKQAEGGTIFLDEIGEMPLALQGKLLRVLQERVIEPVGSNKTEHVDFRVVAATNRDLEQQVNEGKFRGDLFYRLNVVPLSIPALRDRLGDVPVLARHFLNRLTAESGAQLRFSAAAIAELEAWTWPGNVRELENLVERLAVLKGEGEIGVDDLPAVVRSGKIPTPREAVAQVPPSVMPQVTPVESFPGSPRASQPLLPPSSSPSPQMMEGVPQSVGEGVDLNAILQEIEDKLIRDALEKTSGNRKQAARLLNLNRTTLVEKLKKKQKVAAAAAQPPKPEGDDDGEHQ